MAKQSRFKLLVTFIGLLFLAAAVFLGARLLRGEVEQTKQDAARQKQSAAAVTRENAAGATQTREKSPFLLKTVQSEMSGVSYVSFEVYDVGSGGEELVYVCGRQFPAQDVSLIDWDAEESYDIVVFLQNGAKKIYGFDGANTSWQ